MSDTSASYRSPARLLHWTMALLVLGMIPAGFVMVQPGLDRSLGNALFIFHKNVGVLLLILVAIRLAYRAANPAPPLPDSVPPLQRRAAAWSHGALYALLVIMPVAGYVRVKAGGFPIESLDAMGVPSLVPRSDAVAEIAKNIHYFGAIALTALVALHILAAAYHGVFRRDGVFSRMWPPIGHNRRAAPLAAANRRDI